MSNYNCVGCGSYSGSYENKMSSNRSSYSGNEDYASGMPDVKMRDYCLRDN
jgi:hypothetical protein